MKNRLDLEKKLKEVRNNRISSQQLMLKIQAVLKSQLSAQKPKKDSFNVVSDSKQNNFILEYLDADRIYSITDIEKVCTTYRLRFLNQIYFKADVPKEAVQQVKILEEQHTLKLEGLKIMAPAKLIRFKSMEDSFLFAPIGNNYYYLIHNWGNELNRLRKWAMWPMKRIANLIGTIIILSLFVTFIMPVYLIFDGISAQDYFIFFLFNFKWIAILALFYGIAFGKNFSINNWQTKFYKSYNVFL